MEVELGGYGLVALAAVILALCAASFWLGRRSAEVLPARSPAEGAGAGPAADVEKDLSFFDRLEKAPEIQAVPESPAATTAPAAPATAPPAAAGVEVQVFASADRNAAEALAAKLRGLGYRTRLLPADPRGESLHRVRVVGFADEAAARRAAEQLERQQGLRTWVVR